MASIDTFAARLQTGEPWEERAACSGANVEMFFSVEEQDQQEALEYCARCEVRQECLEYAIRHREMYGIWGGMMESDRRTLIRDIRRREREARERRKRAGHAA
ncbi:MAG TPA: WhiB family transcriptional regulator [Nitriliruptorales bacterium]|nr:WhiB family transcriptional regulator [Nitriliruptorales bacterium]